jgi:hypothetical protein
MNRPFDISDAMEELWNVKALIAVSRDASEGGGDIWRALDVASDLIQKTINSLDVLDIRQRRQETSLDE